MEDQRFTQTPASVAEVAGCSTGTVRLAADRGIIASIRDAFGRRLLANDAGARLAENRAATGHFIKVLPRGTGRR